jgi:hypothetical protein
LSCNDCSYVVPTQQLVLTTYIYLFLLAAESIVVYHIVCRHEKRLEANVSCACCMLLPGAAWALVPAAGVYQPGNRLEGLKLETRGLQ